MAKLKAKTGAKKKPLADEFKGLEVSVADMKARILAYKVFRAAAIEVVIRPGSDGVIREFVGPLIGKRSSSTYISNLTVRKKKGPKKRKLEQKTEQESA